MIEKLACLFSDSLHGDWTQLRFPQDIQQIRVALELVKDKAKTLMRYKLISQIKCQQFGSVRLNLGNNLGGHLILHNILVRSRTEAKKSERGAVPLVDCCPLPFELLQGRHDVCKPHQDVVSSLIQVKTE
jgi:hypothetical protein